MALWTEEQRVRWLTARQVLADLINERGCKVREAASARGLNGWLRSKRSAPP